MFYLWLGCGHFFAFYFPNLIHHGIARDFLVLDGEVFYLRMCTAVVENQVFDGTGEVCLLIYKFFRIGLSVSKRSDFVVNPMIAAGKFPPLPVLLSLMPVRA